MIHDIEITDYLATLDVQQLDQTVYRVTPVGKDPLVFSDSGGRWSPMPSGTLSVPVLYTSETSDGAVAEVASYLSLLTPAPSKQLQISEITCKSTKSIQLLKADLIELGVDLKGYQSRNYERSQKIGAALDFLGFDGLIAPSARWDCNNIVFFENNIVAFESLETVSTECISWKDWFKTNGNRAAERRRFITEL